MGCISSKVIARSLSFHEERRLGSQRRTSNGIPLLEDIIISANSNDQYLTLVCAENTVANKLHSRSFSSNTASKPAIEPASSETIIDKLEISASLDQEEGGEQIGIDQRKRSNPQGSSLVISKIDSGGMSFICNVKDSIPLQHTLWREEDLLPRKEIGLTPDGCGNTSSESKRKRSKSCNLFPMDILSSLSQENPSGFEDKYDLSSKGAVRSRSFHTVEEYDEMVKQIWGSKSHRFQQCEFNDEDDDDSGTVIELLVSESEYSRRNDSEDKDSAIKEMQPPCLHNNCSVEEISTFSSAAEESRKVTSSSKSHISSSERIAQRGNTMEKGNKRKAIAKKLESLRIPSNIESPAIASLREWLPPGGIYSPGSYITPKFGSYSQMSGENASESSEDPIFSPELVSAFEQCMQKLEAEEENILKQIVKDLEEENGGKLQSPERTPPFMEG